MDSRRDSFLALMFLFEEPPNNCVKPRQTNQPEANAIRVLIALHHRMIPVLCLVSTKYKPYMLPADSNIYNSEGLFFNKSYASYASYATH